MRERGVAWVLAAVLAAQLLLLSVQAPSPDDRGSNVLESVALRVVAPVGHAVAALTGGVRGVGRGLRSRRALLQDNRVLRGRLEELELELMRRSELEGEVERLSDALDYRRAAGLDVRVADVVYVDHASWLRTLILYVGDQPAEVNQPVISDRGLVGRVVEVVPGYAKVQLITDRAAAVGAMLRRTRRQGVARAGTDGLELAFLPLRADVRPGDVVVTSGIDGIYPRGLPLGTVAEVEEGQELFYRIRLTPAVDFGVLDQVYLLPSRPLPEM